MSKVRIGSIESGLIPAILIEFVSLARSFNVAFFGGTAWAVAILVATLFNVIILVRAKRDSRLKGPCDLLDRAWQKYTLAWLGTIVALFLIW